MKINFKISSFHLSILFGIAIHLLLFVIINVIYFEEYYEKNSNVVNFQFREYEKQNLSTKILPNNSTNLKRKIAPEKTEKEVIDDLENLNSIEITEENADTITSPEIDSLKYFSHLLDSLVVNNPSLLLLKYASKEYLKNNPKLETEEEIAIKRLRNYFQNYFKQRYPTPPSKFGETRGIPIDKIIVLFKGNDDIDIIKIRKYLRLDE